MWTSGFPGLSRWLRSKESTCDAEDAGDPGSVSGQGRSSGGEPSSSLQYSCLENPMDRGAWQVTVHGVTKSWTWLKWLSMHACKVDREQDQGYAMQTVFWQIQDLDVYSQWVTQSLQQCSLQSSEGQCHHPHIGFPVMLSLVCEGDRTPVFRYKKVLEIYHQWKSYVKRSSLWLREV